MPDDRKNVCDVVSEMLDNPGECDIYPTGAAYDKLVALIESARMEALGWMHAEACTALDRGEDIRKVGVPDIVDRFNRDLAA